MLYNLDKVHGNDVLSFKSNPQGNRHIWWHQGEGGIGSFGKWASKGKCDKCDTRVKYCEKAGNPSECK
jgi:hypothetical protein